MAESSSSGFSASSSSSGGSFIPNYPQAPFLQAVANSADQFAQQLYTWGQGVFANTSALTDANVNNYLAQAGSMANLASNNINRYESMFQPQENALIKDANTYASKDRIAQQMGMAEANTGQAMDAARQNAIRDLQSYGIDPSAGRYQALDRISNAQAGAAKAAAGTQAQLATEATGRGLRQAAIQVGQQYPGYAVNATNTGLQAIAGAQNAKLANANTGVNLMGLPKGYLDTAMGLKYPPLGTGPSQSSSVGRQQSQSERPDANQAGQRQSGQGQGTNGMPNGGMGGAASGPKSVINPYGSGGYPGAASTAVPGAQGYEADSNNQFGIPTEETGNPFAGDSGYYGNTQDSYENSGNPFDSQSPTGGVDTAPTDYNNVDPYTFDSPFTPADTGGGADWTSGADYGASDYSDYGGDYGYAKGGAIDGDQQSALPVDNVIPAEASPSGGANQDDVKVNAQVGEFMIPEPVVRWKGEEFFQKLIAQSMKARTTAPAQGKPGPSRPGPATFAPQMR